MDDPAAPARYEIRVRGHLGETLLGAFPGLRAEAQGGETMLAGVLPDRAALYGVLAQIEALGLDLLELRRLPSSQSSPAHHPNRATTAHPAAGDAQQRRPRG
jgi:hypothetical protein